MSEILKVCSGGGMIEVHLQGGNLLMLDCEVLLRQERFRALSEDDRILYPHTDGSCVFWKDGPRLSLSEVLSLLRIERAPE